MRFSTAALLTAAGAATCLALTAATLASDCSVITVNRVPLNDLGAGLYLGQFQGGLYPKGLNSAPAAHAGVGIQRANAVVGLNAAGAPDSSGKYVLLSIGMSNTTQEFCNANGVTQPCQAHTFVGQALVHPAVNHSQLVFVNGAMGGQTASTWDSPSDNNYNVVRDQRLAPQGLSEAQVQAVWVKVANAQPQVSLPAANADAYTLVVQMGNIARALKVRYPNVKVVFFSSRIYAGYASGVSTLNPEPYAYESAFAVKWVVQAQINQMAGGGIDPRAGDLNYNSVAPWIAWGPYLWADGLTPRSDGLTWQCANLNSDGTHPSQSGQEKVGSLLLNFFLTSPFTRPWFRYDPADINGDGFVDVADLLVLIGQWGPCVDCAADISPPGTGNDEVNVSDLLFLLSHWG
jgi:hypothetical protein